MGLAASIFLTRSALRPRGALRHGRVHVPGRLALGELPAVEAVRCGVVRFASLTRHTAGLRWSLTLSS